MLPGGGITSVSKRIDKIGIVRLRVLCETSVPSPDSLRYEYIYPMTFEPLITRKDSIPSDVAFVSIWHMCGSHCSTSLRGQEKLNKV